MSERLEQARRLGQRIDAGWQRADVEAQLARLHARQRGRARRWMGSAPIATAALAAAVAVFVVGRRAPVAPPPAAPAAVVEPHAPPVELPAVRAPVTEPPTPVIAPVIAPHREPRAPAIGNHPAPAVRAELPAAPPASTWRDDAERGDYVAAWAELAGEKAGLASMSDLLLAGDVARLSGHAGEAVAPLARAVALHADDPRAQLAAFTLGRVHLEELGAPRDAALAFARARELAPGGALAEDALAREVEAWSRAGETTTARSRATLYLQRYPAGRRIHAVRQFGGPERR